MQPHHRLPPQPSGKLPHPSPSVAQSAGTHEPDDGTADDPVLAGAPDEEGTGAADDAAPPPDADEDRAADEAPPLPRPEDARAALDEEVPAADPEEVRVALAGPEAGRETGGDALLDDEAAVVAEDPAEVAAGDREELAAAVAAENDVDDPVTPPLLPLPAAPASAVVSSSSPVGGRGHAANSAARARTKVVRRWSGAKDIHNSWLARHRRDRPFNRKSLQGPSAVQH
ncbi:MAG: hypothetical protein HY904_07275 [Deltaproteobacteria bacterium]|nr:hypothetical protein [Deltaproteobacteria bacterium]